MFTSDSIEHFLKDLLLHENFADGILTLHLSHDPTIREINPGSSNVHD
jgi:hypothetical protein